MIEEILLEEDLATEEEKYVYSVQMKHAGIDYKDVNKLKICI